MDTTEYANDNVEFGTYEVENVRLYLYIDISLVTLFVCNRLEKLQVKWDCKFVMHECFVW